MSVQSPKTKVAQRLFADITRLGWTPVPGSTSRWHADTCYLFTLGEWSLSLDENTAGSIVGGSLYRAAPEQRFHLKKGTRSGYDDHQHVVERVCTVSKATDVIRVVASDPALVAWLTAEHEYHTSQAHRLDAHRRFDIEELERRPLAVSGGIDGDRQYREALVRIQSAIGHRGPIHQTPLGHMDTVAQVAVIEQALDTMKALLDPEANEARRAEVAALTAPMHPR